MYWSRILPFFQLIVPLLIATFLVYLQISGWRSSESMARQVAENRATVAVFVQVIAYLLGMLQVQALCTTLRYSYTARMSKQPLPLQHVEFVHAASIPKLSFAAGKSRSIGLFAIVVLCLAPGAIFSASLTPVQSQCDITRSIHIPTFDTNESNDVYPLPDWTGTLINPPYFLGDPTKAIPVKIDDQGQLQWISEQGVYSYDPTSKRGALEDSASFSSLNNALHKLHAKLDNTGYFYANRSYGAGTAAGFADLGIRHEPKWYKYRELGFKSHVSCHFNSSMAFGLIPIYNNLSLAAFTAGGTHPDPNQTPALPVNCFSFGAHGIFSLTAVYPNQKLDPDDKAIYVSMRTGATEADDCWNIRYFDKLQCRIDFEAQEFQVIVNETSKAISVTPTSNSPMPWPLYGDTVVSEVSWWLWIMSAFDGSISGSALGRAMSLNREQLWGLNLYDSSNDTTIKAMEDFLADMVDNTLNLLASTRYVSAGYSTSIKTEVTLPAVVLGSEIYAIAVLVISIFALLIYMSMAMWTRLWHDMIELNLTDMVQVISGALIGGRASTPEAFSSLATDGGKSKVSLTVRGEETSSLPTLEVVAADTEACKLESGSSFDNTSQQTLLLVPQTHGNTKAEPGAG